jgi:carbamate kinase
MPIVVAALGGNAIVGSDPASDGGIDLRRAPTALVRLVALGWDLVITHGNGPQVGQRLAEAQASGRGEGPTLDVLDAETEGVLGYRLQQALGNALREAHLPRPVASVLTQVVVDAQDPAFGKPTKPVGSFCSREQAEALGRERGFTFVEDSGRGYRRVVASPPPLEIVEVRPIRALVEAGVVVIAAGGGGIPVIREPGGGLRGVEAVIDKDRTSSLLARLLGADMLIIFTSVPEVLLDFRGPEQRALRSLSVGEARTLLATGQFAAGSMGPKVEAAAAFSAATGRPAIITSADRLLDALVGTSGTVVRP